MTPTTVDAAPKTLTQEDPEKQPVATEEPIPPPDTGKKAGTDLPPPNGKDKPRPRTA
jgi:hypothetical protein